MHRQAVKVKAEGLFFKVSIFNTAGGMIVLIMAGPYSLGDDVRIVQ